MKLVRLWFNLGNPLLMAVKSAHEFLIPLSSVKAVAEKEADRFWYLLKIDNQWTYCYFGHTGDGTPRWLKEEMRGTE